MNAVCEAVPEGRCSWRGRKARESTSCDGSSAVSEGPPFGTRPTAVLIRLPKQRGTNTHVARSPEDPCRAVDGRPPDGPQARAYFSGNSTDDDVESTHTIASKSCATRKGRN